MSALPLADPGPMARLREVQADEGTPDEVFRMLTERQADQERGGKMRYLTLRQTGRVWGLPARVFAQWFILTYPEVYEAARKARAEDMEHEVLEIADEQSEVERPDGSKYDPEVPRDKLRVDSRLKLMPSLDRERYGPSMRVEKTVSVTADAGLLGTMSELLRLVAEGRAPITIAAAQDVADADVI